MTEFTATGTALAKILVAVKSVVKARSTMAILSHVMIDARDGKVTITATDLDIMIARTFAVEVASAGSFTVEAERFTNVISSFPDGAQVKLSEEDGFVSLVSGRSRFRFPALKAVDFPPMPFDAPVAAFDGTREFLDALAATRHAHAPHDTVRYFMAGSFIGDRRGMEITGTDSDRLSVQRPGMDANGLPDIIVPSAAVDQILKLAPGFKFEAATDKIRCTFGDGELIAKLIDSQYPKYAGVIPPSGSVAKLDCDDLAAALNRIALLSDDKLRTIALTFEKGKLTVRNRMQGGKAEDGVEEMPCTFNGEPMTVAFRSRYLRDALAAMNADDIELTIDQPMSPAKLTSPKRPTMTLVVMPTRA